MKQFTFKRLAVLAAAAAGSTMALAAGPDLAPLTSAIDFGTVITAVLAIAGLLAAVFVAIRGAKTVLSMIKG
jgi:Inovirus Coat protein B